MKRVGWIAIGLLIGLALFGFRTLRQQQLDGQLLEAVRQDPGSAAQLLQAGANPNARDTNGTTALHMAASGRKPEVVSLLAERGAHLNRTDGNGRTALHRAATTGDSSTIQMLVEHGPSLDALDRSQRTPLMLAVTAGFPQAVEILLEAGADPNLENREGETPLIRATKEGLPQICALLLEHEAKVNARDNRGQTALLHAFRLPETGGFPQSMVPSTHSHPSGKPLPPQPRDPMGRPRLPVRTFSRDIVAVLLPAGPDLTVRDLEGRGVLDLAVGRLPGNMVDELRRRGARCSADTDLLLAAALNRPKDAAPALTRGADVNSQDSAGRSVLWWTACQHMPELAERLLKRGADPNRSPESPLLCAVMGQDLAMTRLLLRHGARTGRGPRGVLPLIVAVRNRQADLVEALLAAGADPNASNHEGTIALAEAVATGTIDLIEMLIGRGADVNASLEVNRIPRTLLGRACSAGRADVAEVLYRRGARLTGEDEQWLRRTFQLAAEIRGGRSPSPSPVARMGARERNYVLKAAELFTRYGGAKNSEVRDSTVISNDKPAGPARDTPGIHGP